MNKADLFGYIAIVVLIIAARSKIGSIVLSILFFTLVSLFFGAPLIYLNILAIGVIAFFNFFLQTKLKPKMNKIIWKLLKFIGSALLLCITVISITLAALYDSTANYQDTKAGNDFTAMMGVFIVMPISCLFSYLSYNAIIRIIKKKNPSKTSKQSNNA